MAHAERKRCFDCGATYPAGPSGAFTCENDGTALAYDTVGGRWKIEGVLGPRPGGSIFTARDLSAGAGDDGPLVALELLVPVPVAALGKVPARDAAQVGSETDRFQRQIQALRILEQHSGVLPLIAEGSERDGARYFVTELGHARPLQDLIDEWQQPGVGLLSPAQVDRVARPILGLLSAAHRLGIAHGALDPTQVFLASEDRFVSGLGAGVDGRLTVKVRGLGMLGFGPAMRTVAVADLDGLGAILCELLSGRRPPPGEPQLEPAPERRALAELPALQGPLGQVALRALGLTGSARYQSAEEMLRALVAALSTAGFTAPPPAPPPRAPLTRTDPGSPPLPGMTPAGRTPADPVSQPPHSLPPLPASVPAALRRSLPGIRMSGQFGALPAPPMASEGSPERSGLTSELRQISILDLMQETQAAAPPREETLARSRRRPSSVSLKVAQLPPPPEDGSEPEDEGYAIVQAERSSVSEPDSLEPTRDVMPRQSDYSGPISSPSFDPGPPLPGMAPAPPPALPVAAPPTPAATSPVPVPAPVSAAPPVPAAVPPAAEVPAAVPPSARSGTVVPPPEPAAPRAEAAVPAAPVVSPPSSVSSRPVAPAVPVPLPVKAAVAVSAPVAVKTAAVAARPPRSLAQRLRRLPPIAWVVAGLIAVVLALALVLLSR